MFRYLLYVIAFSALTLDAFSQQIQSLTIIPANPTSSDVVSVTADVANFNYGGCSSTQFNLSQNGFRIDGFSHHLLGGLAVICSSVDNFVLGSYSAGTYTYVHTVTSSTGGMDVDSIQFTVTTTTSVIQPEFQIVVHTYPQPATHELYVEFSRPSNLLGHVVLVDLRGRLVKEAEVQSGATLVRFDLEHVPLENGLYFLKYMTGEHISVEKVLIQR